MLKPHLIFFLLLLNSSAAAQATHTVSVDFSANKGRFTPNELTVELGDTVHWVWVNGFHSVDSFQGLFTSGAPTVGPNTFDVVFDQAFLNHAEANGLLGTSFDYHCTPHLLSGMVANITVALPGKPLLEVSNIVEASVATISVSRATPAKLVGIGYSLTGQGPSNMFAGPCGLLTAELSTPVTVPAILLADAAGSVTFASNVPPNTLGIFVYLQALDLDTCTLSNSGAWRIH